MIESTICKIYAWCVFARRALSESGEKQLRKRAFSRKIASIYEWKLFMNNFKNISIALP